MATLAANADHLSLAEVARSFLAAQGGTGPARAALDAGAPDAGHLPAFWTELEKLGWLGLHLPEEFGGQGFGLAETAVVLEQLGRVVAPGPFLPTVIASAVVDSHGTAAQRAQRLPGLAAGTTVAGLGLAGTLVLRDGRLDGEVPAVLGAVAADLLLLIAGEDAVLVDRRAERLTVTRPDGPNAGQHAGQDAGPNPGQDAGRPAATVRYTGVPVAEADVLRGARGSVLRIARALAAAEAAGLSDACTLLARDYALQREQFGRPIGGFQAVKHHCANMLVDAELAAAAAWGAVQPAAAGDPAGAGAQRSALAAVQALPAAVRCATRNIQVHGGIGYTWEHDAHLYLKRALALQTFFGADADDDAVSGAAAGRSAALSLELPPEAEEFRARIRTVRAEVEALPIEQRPAALARSGYLVPHYPAPFGRDAGPVEQLVVEEELAGLDGRPDLGIGAWILPTLVQHGTAEQRDRWVWPSLRGELRFCQLFSEPDAGSDAAAIRTAARSTDGGWLVTGQKIWTSDAQRCNRGLITVRTDPSAPKHAGVTMMVVDLRATGVEVRPLRDLTGDSAFNEVFLDEVFVPDQDVVGAVGAGWTVARATIGNERVTIGSGLGGTPVDGDRLVELAERHGALTGSLRLRLAEVLAEASAMSMINLKQVRAMIDGHRQGGTDGNVSKLLSAEHSQRATELALALVGPGALSGAEPEVIAALLYSRGLTIGGGTSEISRNQIAERVLGLPREPR